jgi:hypothetical protein
MSMSTPNRFGLVLEKLAAEPPSTKTAMIRSLLPEIEAALASGKTWKQLWQSLADDALDISFRNVSHSPSTGPEARISAPPKEKSLEFPGVCAQETADGVAREPHSHSAHRRIGTRVRLGVAVLRLWMMGAGRYSRMMKPE